MQVCDTPFAMYVTRWPITAGSVKYGMHPVMTTNMLVSP